MALDLLSLARRMIAIDTTSARSNRELIEFLLPLCEAAGLHVELQQEVRDGVPQYNLLATRRALDRDTLLLATHSDTVPPGDRELWTATGGDPFALTEADGMLYGLGTADVKLDLLCKLVALESLAGVGLRDNVALAATYGEETGRYGAKLLVQELGRGPGPALPRRVLVGEPTGLRPGTAHKGYAEFRVTGTDPAPRPVPGLPLWRLIFAGAAAHSSQPHRGVSANSACLDALAATIRHRARDLALLSVNGGEVVNKVAARCEAVVASSGAPGPEELLLPEWAARGVVCFVEPVRDPESAAWSPELGRLLLAAHDLTGNLRRGLAAWPIPGFDPPYSTVNNGLVRLGMGRLSHVTDVRRVPGDEPGALLDVHEAALQRLMTTGPPHGEGLRVQTERALDSAPFRTDPDSELLASLMIELGVRGLPLQPELKSGTTEAPVYHAAGMDTVIFGPGQAAGNIHRPNEHVPLSDLRRCADIYRDLIIRLCSA